LYLNPVAKCTGYGKMWVKMMKSAKTFLFTAHNRVQYIVHSIVQCEMGDQ